MKKLYITFCGDKPIEAFKTKKEAESAPDCLGLKKSIEVYEKALDNNKEKAYNAMLERLIEIEEVFLHKNGTPCWNSCGEPLDGVSHSKEEE